MNGADYFVDILVQEGVKEVFGIPGGVVLEFLYGLDRREEVSVHLSFHEQAAAYAACGYAQASGKLGVAYATRGPGFTNMITAIADAYYDGISVLFVTAHANYNFNNNMRFEETQELDILPMVKGITKGVVKIDTVKDLCEIRKICKVAQEGRRGPVVIDISNKILKSTINEKDISDFGYKSIIKNYVESENILKYVEVIKRSVKTSRRPIILIGDGVRQNNAAKEITYIAEKYQIPVLSSRVSQDIMTGKSIYYGYIGSHATRYSNFILAKSDLIIALGNRMAFNLKSESFRQILGKKIIRIDVDDTEFLREIPNSTNINLDVSILLEYLVKIDLDYKNNKEWVSICNEIRDKLWNIDVDLVAHIFSDIINDISLENIIVSDVGNNELWFSRAYAFTNRESYLINSKSFKAVGSALCKSIGAYYAKMKPVICIIGDQGIQFNIQEFQFVAANKLPIKIVILNNFSSGLMCSDEKRQGYSYFVHTTYQTGYSAPDFEKVANTYGIGYFKIVSESNYFDQLRKIIQDENAYIIDLQISDDIDVLQKLPKGYPCQKFIPELDDELYNYIENL